MSSGPPREPGAAAWGATLRAQVIAELERVRRMRWMVAGATVVVAAVLVWAITAAPASDTAPLWAIAVLLGIVTTLFGLEVVTAGTRARRLERMLAAEEHQRRSLTSEYDQLEAVDVAARRLAGVTSLPDAVESILANARGLVPAVSGAVLLAAAADLQVSLTGRDVTDEAAVSPGGQQLATRALSRGAALRGGHDTALDEQGAPSRLAVPLRAVTDVVGVLVLERATDTDPFTPGEQRLLERLAPHAALALVRAGQLADRPGGTASSGDALGPGGDGRSAVAAGGDDAVAAGPGGADVGAGGADVEVGGADIDVALVPGTPSAPAPAVPVDVSEVLREVVAELEVLERPRRRIAVLASTSAPARVERAALRRALEALLTRLDRALPPDGAVAIEVLPVGPDWEIAIAHAGEVLPEEALAAPPPEAPEAPSLRALAAGLGGAVSARERSGMAQLRFRVPGVDGRAAAPSTDRWHAAALS